MPWDLTIFATRPDDETPLGSVEFVQSTLRSSMPDIEFEVEASGVEMLASGVQFPPALRDFLASRPATCTGRVSRDDCHVQFDLGSEAEIFAIPVEVRGGGDPLPSLWRLAEESGWVMIDSSTGESIPVHGAIPEGLRCYRTLVATIGEGK